MFGFIIVLVALMRIDGTITHTHGNIGPCDVNGKHFWLRSVWNGRKIGSKFSNNIGLFGILFCLKMRHESLCSTKPVNFSVWKWEVRFWRYDKSNWCIILNRAKVMKRRAQTKYYRCFTDMYTSLPGVLYTDYLFDLPAPWLYLYERYFPSSALTNSTLITSVI